MDRIERLMKDWEPALRKAFLEAVKGMRGRVNLRDLATLLKARDVEGAIKLLGLEPAAFLPLDRTLQAAYVAGGVDASQGIGLRIAPLFDAKTYSAQAYLQGHTTELIRQITEDQRAMVRQILSPLMNPLGADPMLTGDTPQKLALDLVGRISKETGKREGGVLGLTSQQAEWATNYERELSQADPAALTRKLRDKRFDRTVQKAITSGQPIPEKTRQAMVAAYRNRALLLRANAIAENEASTALHASQTEAWEQAIARGAVAESAVRRFWITAGDDRVRPTHRMVPGMNKAGVRLHEPFQTPKGPTMQPGWSFDPGCRCRVRVRVVEEASPESRPSPRPSRLLAPA